MKLETKLTLEDIFFRNGVEQKELKQVWNCIDEILKEKEDEILDLKSENSMINTAYQCCIKNKKQ